MKLRVLNDLTRRDPTGVQPDGRILDRRLWLADVPRLAPLCRLLGHRPIIDGHDSGAHRSRWVVCARCRVRPQPQGHPDPDTHPIGAPYTGPMTGRFPTRDELDRAFNETRTKPPTPPEPGPWPTDDEFVGTLGAEIILGNSFPSWSAEVKVGSTGSEHVLAAHLHAGNLAWLSLHTEDHGRGLAERLNPDGNSRVIAISAAHGLLSWRLWVRRDDDGPVSQLPPRWRRGTLDLRVLDRLFGPERCEWTDEVKDVEATVRMPHGDDHRVRLTLQRWCRNRSGGPLSRFHHPRGWWAVDVHADLDRDDEDRFGIPTKPGQRGRIVGFHVDLDDPPGARAATDGSWPMLAAARAAERMAADRASNGYRTPAQLTADREVDEAARGIAALCGRQQ